MSINGPSLFHITVLIDSIHQRNLFQGVGTASQWLVGKLLAFSLAVLNFLTYSSKMLREHHGCFGLGGGAAVLAGPLMNCYRGPADYCSPPEWTVSKNTSNPPFQDRSSTRVALDGR